jgi:replicative superfamily II helicase
MIDFTKQLKKKTIKQRINPIEIYDDLDRNSEVGPLRPSQENILNDWDNSHRYDHDLLIKLHTGEGKTLIGLLILLSTMNEKRLPCIYLCPNRYLVDQVFWDADKFGIPTCLIDYTNNRFPQEFLDANSILITTAQKLFNGRSIFKTGSASLKVESIVLDDSHACIAAIEEGLTIKIPSTYKGKSIEAYTELKDLFSDSLKMQGAGSYLDLNNEESDVVIPIPYWSWNQKVDIVTEVLSKYSEEDYLLYIWPLYRDSLRYCEAFICSKRIEIKPFKFPIEQFGTFSRANQRILMSATTQNDSFFIKGFNFSPKVIKSPLTVPDQRWSGEKMVIIPSMVSEKFNRETVLDYFFKRQKRFGFGVVSLIPSYSKKYSEIYRENEAKN